jgi:predicted RND superfamily exporter protein
MKKYYYKIGEFIIGHRLIFLILIILSTLFFGYKITDLKVESITTDLFPENHPYVETYVKYQDIFGGANVLIMDLEVKEGDIFNTKTLEKIRKITKELELMPSVNNYQVLSLAQRKVKKITVDPKEGFQSIPVMWPEIPQDEEGIKKLEKTVYTTPKIIGSLVSIDRKAALIVAGFFDKDLNPREIYDKINSLIENQSDSNTEIHAIGRPMLLGYILSRYSQLAYFFIATVLSIILVLLAYFRDLRGVLIPILTAIITAIWGLGFLAIMKYNFDPLIIVVPFIIAARALSHSVQLVERYFEEYEVCSDRKTATINTFAGLFEPGMVSIIADAACVLAVMLTPIPLMQKLAIMGAFWLLSIIISNVVFNPVILTYFPPPPKKMDESRGAIVRILTALANFSIGRKSWIVIVITGIVFIVGFLFARNIVIGDMNPGTPMLWPDSKYNLDTAAISEKFSNTEVMSIVVEGKDRNAIKHPDVLNKMASLQRELEQMPEVGGTSSIADFIPTIIKALHGGDPKWELIPTDHRESGFFLEMIYSGSEPGDLTRFVTQDSKNANIAIYLKDHRSETLKKVTDRAKKFVEQNPINDSKCIPELGCTAKNLIEKIKKFDYANLFPNSKFLLAGGYGGLLAAVNEVITRTEAIVTILAFGFVFFFCLLTYRSFVAGILFLIPLIISNYVTYSIMGFMGIGLDVNALPVVSLGVGLGVDYGLYIVSRMKEEYALCNDLKNATIRGITTAGKAVVFTASTMILGVVFWSFSYLKFQADMGLLLVFWMIVSMLGGLILLPILINLFKPKFIFRV